MRFRLRTLLIILTLGPPFLAVMWFYRLQLPVVAGCLLLYLLTVWSTDRSLSRIASRSFKESLRRAEQFAKHDDHHNAHN